MTVTTSNRMPRRTEPNLDLNLRTNNLGARALRILFVINSPIIGGAERHTFDLALGLTGMGCPVTVFAIKPGPRQPDPSVRLRVPATWRGLARRLRELSEEIREDRPDIVVSVNERPVMVAGLGRWLAGGQEPFIAISHSTVLNNNWERFLQLLYNRFFNRANSVIFVSHKQSDYWSNHGMRPRRAVTIHNGVDPEFFSRRYTCEHRAAARARFGFQDGDFVVGCCAVMRPEKNHLQLLSVVASLRRRGIPAKALLVGDGVMRAVIEAHIVSLSLQSAVFISGVTEDVRPFIAAFDVGALCSVSIETLSLAALEIMSMGIPMVMSDLGGASEIIDDTNGALFRVGDDRGFEDALSAFVDVDRRGHAGEAARRTVEARFQFETMVESYHRHFRDVLMATLLRNESRLSPSGTRL